MGLLKFLGNHSPAHIRLRTRLATLFGGGRLIGSDEQGNRYFASPARKGYNHDRRWVMYNGEVEASRVPPEWHGWLHHQTDAVPRADGASYRQPWQLPHQQNLTGTTAAYRPPGHVLAGGRREKATGDYQGWTPDEK